MKGVDELLVSVVGQDGRWEVLLEVNGKEWKRYGPWPDRKTADVYAADALRRAEKVARRFWDVGGGRFK